jgi:hypothetical protein
MELTDEQADLLTLAWLLARDGHGMVVTDESVPDADALAQRGWLERFLRDGQLCWRWPAQAEHALDVAELLQGTAGRQN